MIGPGVAKPAVKRFLVGDVVAIGVFLVAGELHHGIDPIAAPLVVADTIAPFLLGWFVVAPVLGAYREVTVSRPGVAVVLIGPAWLGANVVGQLVRSTATFHGGSSPVFTVVVGIGGVVALCVWRVVAVLVFDNR